MLHHLSPKVKNMNSLPLVILQMIFSFLDRRSLMTMSTVSKTFHRVIRDMRERAALRMQPGYVTWVLHPVSYRWAIGMVTPCGTGSDATRVECDKFSGWHVHVPGSDTVCVSFQTVLDAVSLTPHKVAKPQQISGGVRAVVSGGRKTQIRRRKPRRPKSLAYRPHAVDMYAKLLRHKHPRAEEKLPAATPLTCFVVNHGLNLTADMVGSIHPSYAEFRLCNRKLVSQHPD
jgi:hypothetical protein